MVMPSRKHYKVDRSDTRFLEILRDIGISLFAESHSDVTYFGVSCEEFRR